MKTCVICDREFNWMDYGSTSKFDRMRICPDCEHAKEESKELEEKG